MTTKKHNKFLVQTLIPPSLDRWVKDTARKNGLSVSAWLRKLLAEEQAGDRGASVRARLTEVEQRLAVLERAHEASPR